MRLFKFGVLWTDFDVIVLGVDGVAIGGVLLAGCFQKTYFCGIVSTDLVRCFYRWIWHEENKEKSWAMLLNLTGNKFKTAVFVPFLQRYLFY